MWHDVGFRVVIWWMLRRWSLHSRGRIWRFGAIFGECFGDVTRSTPVAPSSPSTSPEACGVNWLDSKIVGVSLHRSGQRSCSPFWFVAASCKGTEGWHAWVSKLQGLWSFFFWRMSKDQDLKSRGTTDGDGGRGCQWVPSIGVGYSWTRKGSQRMQFRQLLWLTENTRRAWLHWGRIYVVWPRRPSWSCFWKSFWAAL